ncbi:sensor histidine kinase [Marinobacterium jannaschii]|uniref:sensor histidine kinase n=1 Tax=Marinobacterium jannaschii TaxID=64970 RepID=UPI000489BE94|nr:ATP-binding protein [Marinobacterium jannaschii]
MKALLARRGVFITGLFWCLMTLGLAVWFGKVTRSWEYSALQEQAADRLLGDIQRIRGALDEYRYLPFLLTQNDDVLRLLYAENLDNWGEVSRYLEQTNLVAGASGLFILNRHGQTLAYSHWRDANGFLSRSHARQPYFIQARAGEEGRYYSHSEGKRPAWFLSAPIYNQQSFVGAAVVRIDLQALIPKLQVSDLFTVSDDQGVVLMTSRQQWFRQPLEQLATRKQIRLDDGARAELWLNEGERLLAQSVRLDDLGWTFTALVSTREAEQSSQRMVLATLGAGFLLGILLLYLRERQLKQLSQQETRQALTRSEEQQRAIISQSEVGLITLNCMGQIRFINPMAQRLFGVSEPLVTGLVLSDLIAGLDNFGPLRRALERLVGYNFSPLSAYEAVGLRGDGTEFPMMISLRRMQREPEPQYLVTVIDISRRKRAEHALREANESLEQKVAERTRALESAQEELLQAEKLAALGRMSAAVVHELNQPLTAMRTYVAICRQLLDQPQMLNENLAMIDDITQRMAVITSQLKTFAYKKPQHLAPVGLCGVIDQALLLFHQRFQQSSIQLDYLRITPEPAVMGDSARLEQVVVNLLKNACDAMEQQGGGCLRIGIAGDEQQVWLDVADSGPGIGEDQRAKLFEPFYTTKSIGSGLGLGLAIVSSIVRDLNGTIEVVGSDLGGACFRVQLPRAERVGGSA